VTIALSIQSGWHAPEGRVERPDPYPDWYYTYVLFMVLRKDVKFYKITNIDKQRIKV